MPKEPDREMKLPSLDELFSSQEERDDATLKRIYEIPIDEIDPFPDHPYKVKDDDDMMTLMESIKENGIITPDDRLQLPADRDPAKRKSLRLQDAAGGDEKTRTAN